MVEDMWKNAHVEYRKPTITREYFGLFMRRSNGSARYLTMFESLMYKMFRLWPRDYWTHKDRRGYIQKEEDVNQYIRIC